jgi:HAD superfamily hydrolase (TIGR01509 family)
LTREAGYVGAWEDFIEDWCCHLVLNPDMLTTVEVLAARRRVMIFSNTNAEHWARAIALSNGRLAVFPRVLSHEIGAVKPDPQSFARVTEAAGVAPGAILFFDDVTANVEGARRAGWRAECFENRARLQADLTRWGVSL